MALIITLVRIYEIKFIIEHINVSNKHHMSPQPVSNNSEFINEISVGEIHSMYQDLFLTDMKREVEDAQTELKQWKQETNVANHEINALKKEHLQLQATLKRYRKMVQEMSAEQYPNLRNERKKTERYNAKNRIETKIGTKYDSLSGEKNLGDAPFRAFTQIDPLKIRTHHR